MSLTYFKNLLLMLINFFQGRFNRDISAFYYIIVIRFAKDPVNVEYKIQHFIYYLVQNEIFT